MATPTNLEQELLELINRARSNPFGEIAKLIPSTSPVTGANADITNALTFFKVNVGVLQQQLTGVQVVAPLAWNSALGDAASLHSLAMINADQQTHQAPGEAALGARLVASGYNNLRAGGENVFAFASSTLQGHAGFYIDWGNGANGIQDPPGHRNNILSSNFTEVGIDVTAENNSATSVGPFLITQDFGARSNYLPQVLGVVFRDADADAFYDAGEGVANATVTLTSNTATFTTTTWSSGGYQIAVPAGAYTVTFSGAGIITKTGEVSVTNQNVKLDLNDALSVPITIDPALPASVVFKFVNGTAPDAAKLASLSSFAQNQFDYYKGLGVARPEIGPFEALGVGFSETVQFSSKFGGTTSKAGFVTSAYSMVFERVAGQAQVDHFVAQVNFYESLYLKAGISAAQATAWSKGAIVGQMLATAALDEPSAHPGLVGLSASAASDLSFMV